MYQQIEFYAPINRQFHVGVYVFFPKATSNGAEAVMPFSLLLDVCHMWCMQTEFMLDNLWFLSALLLFSSDTNYSHEKQHQDDDE